MHIAKNWLDLYLIKNKITSLQMKIIRYNLLK